MSRKKAENTESKVTMKIDREVHAWLVLLAEKYKTTHSGVLYKLISENEPDIIHLQNEIEALKQKKLHEHAKS